MNKNFFLLILIISFVKCGYSQTNIYFSGIGGKIGFVIPENPIDNTFSISAHADLGSIFERVYVGTVAEFWSKSYNASSLPNDFIDGKWSEFILAPTFKLKYYTGTKAISYLGGGIGLAFVSFKNNIVYLNRTIRTNISEVEAAFFFMGEIEYPFTELLKGIGELKYLHKRCKLFRNLFRFNLFPA